MQRKYLNDTGLGALVVNQGAEIAAFHTAANNPVTTVTTEAGTEAVVDERLLGVNNRKARRARRQAPGL